ncbi:MAG: hypothetical protein J7463_05740 [Roseiflexus sp.]|jgi:hypothetical protein|nr:hypothetical protein [Roseiflexus sp.]MBO9333733.1 hypothetical protein [Roseiflexus sp.]MBO9340508.1 hypothetical protein [Roseiflexus sp.]MBO9363899.1 hypothetical protein [Roseiflexus sp.]MBO9382171.1 hypothetical protein [Roseiflexus sp.]
MSYQVITERQNRGDEVTAEHPVMPLRASATDEELAVVHTEIDLMRYSQRFGNIDWRTIDIDALDFHPPPLVIVLTLLNNRL